MFRQLDQTLVRLSFTYQTPNVFRTRVQKPYLYLQAAAANATWDL